MEYYLAPMEGLTSDVFRRAHHKYFSGVEKYYLPFISPTQDHLFTKRELKELLPEHNEGINAVPQLLTKRGEDFVWAASELGKMGYPEVNLNLGCPSGTVAAKGKGSGFLRDPKGLTEFFDHVFSAGLDVKISVKTRLGFAEEEEFEALLDIYNRYPIAQLTIHPRVKKDMYKGVPRMNAFVRAVEVCRIPLCYNGDMVTADQCRAVSERFPSVQCAMIGRGLIGDPALAEKAGGGAGADKDRPGAFLEEVYRGYAKEFQSERNAMLRMKEIWFYLIHLFEDSERYGKKLRKTTDHREYEELVEYILRDLELKASLEEWVFRT